MIPCAYVMPAEHFLGRCGAPIGGPWFVPILAIAAIEECPHRLPAEIATRVHNAGESGMGYCLFTLKYADGSKSVFEVSSTGLDFVDYPAGKSPADVVDVVPHAGAISSLLGRARGGREFKWAVFDGVAG